MGTVRLSVKEKQAIEIFRLCMAGYKQLHMIQPVRVAQTLTPSLKDIKIPAYVSLNFVINGDQDWPEGRLTGTSSSELLLPCKVPVLHHVNPNVKWRHASKPNSFKYLWHRKVLLKIWGPCCDEGFKLQWYKQVHIGWRLGLFLRCLLANPWPGKLHGPYTQPQPLGPSPSSCSLLHFCLLFHFVFCLLIFFFFLAIKQILLILHQMVWFSASSKFFWISLFTWTSFFFS